MDQDLTKKPKDEALVRGSGQALATRSAALVKRGLDLLEEPKREFTFIDLLAGIGGMRLGVEAAGGRCVYTCEWEASSRLTYERNFPILQGHRFDRDIREVASTDIPDHDLLVAGLPCQPFNFSGLPKKATLGRPHGFESNEQVNIFFTIASILQAHRPAGFILESVTNLQSHDGGKTFRVMTEVLGDLGYHVHHRVINAKGYVPQNRERLFIVGFREQTSFDFTQVPVANPSEGPKLRSVLHPEDGSEAEDPPYTFGERATVADKYVLTEHLWDYLRDYAAKHKALGHGFGFRLVKPDDTARALSARYFKDGSDILVDRGTQRRPRRLTPRECARLMGFDGPHRQPFAIPVSDTRAYRQFGNAVVVPVVTAVAAAMKPYLVPAIGSRQLGLGEGQTKNPLLR